MPIINIEFDELVVSKEDMIALSEISQKIVSEITGIEDVVVYTNSADIKVNSWAVEIFVRISERKVTDPDELLQRIKEHLAEWKKVHTFNYPINLSLIPMPWKVAVDI